MESSVERRGSGGEPLGPEEVVARLGPRRAIQASRRRLLRHFDRHRRALPWRGENDPYRILVSEFMLQQTRVETVLRYYGRWMDRFPDLESLADAGEDDVLLQWQGLGYYQRARRLHGAARIVRDRFDGSVPSTVTGLRALPGVGEYTAAAVASMAFGVPVAAVDGNVNRVVARLSDLARPSPAAVRGVAEALLDDDRPGDFNQALMELGATVCTPRTARCDACPLASICRAHAAGTVHARPAPVRRGALPRVRFALAVLTRPDGRVLLVRRPPDGLLAGLWAFPEATVPEEGDAEDAARDVAAALGFGVGVGAALPPVRHEFTHLRAVYLPVLFHLPVGRAAPPGARWVALGSPQRVALPTAQTRVMAAVARHAAGGGPTVAVGPAPAGRLQSVREHPAR